MRKVIGLILAMCMVHGGIAGGPLQLPVMSGFDNLYDTATNENHILNNVRLPRNVYPTHYDLQLRPILDQPLDSPEQFTAPGEVTIHVECHTVTDSITLHANEIDILHDDITVTHATSGAIVPVIGAQNDSSVSTYTIMLGENLILNDMYRIKIPFTSYVGDRLSGLYRSSYVDDEGNTRWIATTQFQKLGARLAFPCFDEPNFKSTFNITIGRVAPYHVLSNGPLVDSVPIPVLPNWVWDQFALTVRMPTYLVAIIVSDFVSVSAPENIAVYDVKTWGPPTMTNNATGEFSARAAAEILMYFENYFNYTYQFPKLDSVAIPDFAAGAMENWALNTYRVILMLWFQNENTQFELWRQSAVISHEISHHWFGNLVTCDWWNDLWLNEGFARYLQFLGASITLPDHGVIDRYPLDVLQIAFENDAGPSTEPVHSNVTDEVVNQNSRIIYEKGAALIRMMQGFLTENTLISALRTYLKQYEYQNTVQDQLFAALQSQAVIDGTQPPFTVKQIMDTWTLKSGFPLVRVSRASDTLVFISQEAFVPLSMRQSAVDPEELWYIPVNYATSSNPDFSETNWQPAFWMDKDTLLTSFSITDTNEWLIVNPDARHYYRVVYDTHFITNIKAQLSLDHNVISLSSRSQLIDDYFKSAAEGYVSLESALDLTVYLVNETENTVWTTVLNNLRYYDMMLQDHPAYSNFSTYMLERIGSALTAIQWTEQPTDLPVTVILRSQLIDWACKLNHPNCESFVTAELEKVANNTHIPGDIQPVVYCKGVSMADSANIPTDFDVRLFVEDSYKNATRPERHTVFINARACEANTTMLESLMADTTDVNSPYSPEHALSIVQKLGENPSNREELLMLITMYMIPIVERFEEIGLASVIQSMAKYTYEPLIVDSLNQTISSALLQVSDPSAVASLESSRVQLEENINWGATTGLIIQNWLSARSLIS